MLTVLSLVDTYNLKLAVLLYNGSTGLKYHKGNLLIAQDSKSVIKNK